MTAQTAPEPVANDLAFEMSGRAYQALAIMFELTNPGEFRSIQAKIRHYVADNFRSVEETLNDDATAEQNFKSAVLRVRAMLVGVELDVARMNKPAEMAGG